MVCVVCCKCSQKKEVFLIWVVDLVRAVETGGRGGGTRVDVVVVLGLILKCWENSTLSVKFQKHGKTNVFAQIPKINQNSIVLIVL